MALWSLTRPAVNGRIARVIQLSELRYSIGPRVLFDRVSWVISPGDRVALVGPNGAGKTTLIRVLLGEYSPESGTCVLARGTRVGYLPQEAAERFDGTVFERGMEAHRTMLDMREELDALHQSLAGIAPDDPRLQTLLERAGELQHHLEVRSEHTLEPEARRVLGGLGFSTHDQDRPLAEFSGGWRMRAALAALLLADPTVLFMDEPTNHLDLPAMEWLEEYLADFHGALVVVSHDRVFLDRVATEVRELDRGLLTHYNMKFSQYLVEKELRRDQLEAQNAQIAAKVAQLQRFVERFGAKNTKAAQAQSKRKQIDRLREQHVVLPRPPRGLRFQFPEPPHAGRTLVRLRDVGFGYGEDDVLRHVRTEIEKGDKLAIVGANGAGKTTLLRLLGGQLAPRTGEREAPPLTRLAYFAQHAAETLDPGLNVLEALEEVSGPEWRPRLRSLLGSFLFSGDDVFKRCGVLSGGERQRVALARMLLTPANLLLLDEPTHHLDLAGKEVLEDALQQYPGAVVVVTHDRSLMASVARRVLAVDGGKVTLYPGGYDDWESARLSRLSGDPEPVAVPASAPDPPVARRAKVRAAKPPVPAHPPDRDLRRARERRDREVARIEKELAHREKHLAELEGRLADPDLYHDVARSQTVVAEYERTRAEIESLWARLGELN